MKPYKVPNESPFFMLQDGAFNFKKASRNGKVTGNLIQTGPTKIGKKFDVLMALTRKPYNVWGSCCGWFHMTTSTLCKLSFVQFWGGHVKIFVELIWNYPFADVRFAIPTNVAYKIRTWDNRDKATQYTGCNSKFPAHLLLYLHLLVGSHDGWHGYYLL